MAVFLNTSIDAATRKYALLGARLPYTWSPQIHNTLFSARGVNAVYLPIAVAEWSLASAVEVLRQSFHGFNVTVPYKEAIIPLLDELDETASDYGAVNTVTIGEDGALTGHNTDGIGLVRALEEAWADLNDIHALVIGGGGAARAAAYEMLRRGNRVTIAVRAPARAEKLAAELAARQRDGDARLRLVPLEALAREDHEYDLLMHCTPVGTFPDAEGCAAPEAVVARCRTVFDAVYNPPQTRLLQLAREQGAKCVGGFGMLFYQAVEAQRRWLGGAPTTRVQREMRRALEQMI
jgi:shikimate dehydrogenase